MATPSDLDYFASLTKEMVAKREDPTRVYTGAKALRSELLAYFAEFGEVMTANVWARNLPSNLRAINEFKQAVFEGLKRAGCVGVVEVHLSDREINSPHIQYVGTRAHEAEMVVAHELVKRKFELSVESAVGRRHEEFVPYFEENKFARVSLLENAVSEQRLGEDARQIVGDEFFDRTKAEADTLANMLSNALAFSQQVELKAKKPKKSEDALRSEISRLKAKLGL